MSFYFPVIGTGIYVAALITLSDVGVFRQEIPHLLLVSTSVIMFILLWQLGLIFTLFATLLDDDDDEES